MGHSLPVHRILAIDWSGAKVGFEHRIWLSEVVGGRVVRLESGRSRQETIDEVISVGVRCRLAGERLTGGLDFSFGFPKWFADDLGVDDGPSLWGVTAARAEEWLAQCDPPFWGRAGKRNPHPGERGFRQTEVVLRPHFAPKSTFQIGGAGSVGTGSLRGIPFLLELAAAGFAIWPFGPLGQCSIVEMYPRMHTGPVVKSNEVARRAYLNEARFDGIEMSPSIRQSAIGSEDAFDALLSAIGMWRRVVAGVLPPSPSTLPTQAAIEGWIW